MSTSRIANYGAMFRHWAAMASGTSYWHVSQGPGTLFVPGELAGYFNDLTAKANWTGPVDNDGLPLVRIGSALVRFPTTLFQKALGHWDLWLRSHRTDASHESAVFRIADWALRAQDPAGGWALPAQQGCRYSAMAQGQAASLLCRTYSVFGTRAYLVAAVRAIALMLQPVRSGGTAHNDAGDLVLEEVPSAAPRTILNGWIFAIYGLYDLQLTQSSSDLLRALHSTLESLVRWLPRYDAGFWSLYDTSGALASPFYHRLHIAQLHLLAMTFPQWAHEFQKFEQQFAAYQHSGRSQARAVIAKACQKLLDPPEVVVE